MDNEEKEKHFTPKELRWEREVGVEDFSKEEMLKLIYFAKMLISKRSITK